MKRLVAFLFHAPGLFVFYGERPPLLRANLVAVLATLLAAGIAYQRAGLGAAVWAWGIGHFLWGAVLAWKLR